MRDPRSARPRHVAVRAPLGVVLAGGRATRMGGGDKGLLRLGAGTLLDEVLARLIPQVARAAINANGDPARFAGQGVPVIADGVAGHQGPLAGVLAGLDWAAAEGASHVVTVAADTPFFPCDLVPQLQLAAEGSEEAIAIAATRGGEEVLWHPTFGLWPVALREDLRAALARGDRRVAEWARGHNAAQAVFPDADAFFNVNTPADLDRARRMIG